METEANLTGGDGAHLNSVTSSAAELVHPNSDANLTSGADGAKTSIHSISSAIGDAGSMESHVGKLGNTDTQQDAPMDIIKHISTTGAEALTHLVGMGRMNLMNQTSASSDNESNSEKQSKKQRLLEKANKSDECESNNSDLSEYGKGKKKQSSQSENSSKNVRFRDLDDDEKGKIS
ncbi:hypothetical protein APHAL10511_005038, partial [Amanita phalloides]